MKKILPLFASLLFQQAILAQNTWTGGTNTNWNLASNWSIGQVPAASDEVIIAAASNQPVISDLGVVAKAVEVQSNAVLTIGNGGSLAVDGTRHIAIGFGGINTAFYIAGTVHNNGLLQIGNPDTYGLYNEGTLNNNGQLRIGNVSAGGFVSLYNTAIFNNSQGGQITIDNSKSAALHNFSGTFTNVGTINIGAAASVGGYSLLNSGDFNNNKGGQITLERSGAGLANFEGSFTNAGTITIGSLASVGAFGISNTATFNNNPGGQITINNMSTGGINNAEGTFTNAATISIGSLASVGLIGLINHTIFNNDQGGQIAIDNATSGVLNSGTLTNAASITLGALASVGPTGILSGGTFNNTNCSAVLRVVSNSIISAPYFTNAGTVIENASGESFIGTNTGLVQDLGGGTFTIINSNTGVLTTTAGNIWKGCTSTEWIRASNWSMGSVPTALDDVVIPAATNQPAIYTLGAVARSVEVQNDATLTIGSTGRLAVNGSKDVSNAGNVTFYNIGTVDNNGQLLIGNLSAAGARGLVNFATFNNNAGGQIKIDRSNQYGLLNDNGSNTINGTFTNAGVITIGGVASIGQIGLLNNANFDNSTSGQIQIDRSSLYGLSNGFNAFTNRGSITVGALASTGDFGLRNLGTFNNSSCAFLTLFAPLNNSGTLTSNGLFTVNTTSPHTNTGFANNGILVYPQGNPIPNVTNQALVVAPLSTCATVITPALAIGTSNPFTIGSTWYKDQALTQAAGTYAVAANTFTASTAATGTSTVYFTISNGSACTQTVSIPLTLKPALQFTSTLTPDAICNKTSFNYTPAANLTGTIFSWSRAAVSGIANAAATGAGSISEVLTNTSAAPVKVNYAFTLDNTNGCSGPAPYNVVVTVQPSPLVKTKNLTVYLGSNGQVSITPQQVDNGSQVFCGTLNLSLDKSTFNCTNTGAPVQVNLTATDNNNDRNSASALVTVLDNLKPVISCPSNLTVNPTSLNGAAVNYSTPLGADNCTGAITQRTAGMASGATFPIGATTVSYKVTDASTNSVSCSFTVTVRSPYSDNKNQKAYVCHKGNTLSIDKKDVQDHLNHGDKLGRCDWYSAKTSSKAGSSAQQSTSVTQTDEENEDLKLYPNPTRDKFAVELHLANSTNSIAKIELMNVMGKIVLTDNAIINNRKLYKNVSISSSLPAGIYVARITVNNKTYTTKLIYEK